MGRPGPRCAPLGGATVWCECRRSSPSGRGAEVERQLRGGRGGALSGHGELEVLVGRRPGGTALDPRFRRSGREICIWHILEFASLCGDGNGCAHRVSACVTETFKLVSEMVASPYTPSRLTKSYKGAVVSPTSRRPILAVLEGVKCASWWFYCARLRWPLVGLLRGSR